MIHKFRSNLDILKGKLSHTINTDYRFEVGDMTLIDGNDYEVVDSIYDYLTDQVLHELNIPNKYYPLNQDIMRKYKLI
jgi:hypothetical protein